MLKTTCNFEKAFDKYDEQESLFRSDLKDDVPDYFDWLSINKMVQLLQYFYDMTLRICGS